MKASQLPSNEAVRLSALKELNLLDTASEQDFDDITRLAAQVCDMPIALISLVDENRQWLKSRHGLAISEISRDNSFCSATILQQSIMIVSDALLDERFKHNPLVTGEPFIRFYAGVPIKSETGFAIGTLSISDNKSGNLTEKEVYALEVLARQVEALIELRSKNTIKRIACENLSAFNNNFRLALEKIGDNVWEHDFKTGITSFSKTKNQLLGVSPNKLTDNSTLWWESVHKDDLHLLEENDRKYRAGKIDAHCLEYRMVQKDGTVKWVLDRGVVIEKMAEGLPLKLIGTHTDITSIKKNAAALKESQQRWQFALEGSGDGIWDWDVPTGKVFFSKRWKEMLGYREEEIGDELHDRDTLVHPDDFASMHNELQNHFSGAMPFYQSEHRLLCKDGTYKWILDRGMVITRDDSNQPLRVIGTHTDISQIKYTELSLEQRLKQFRSLSDNIPGVIYEYEFREDGTEGLRYVSPAIERLFGIPPPDFYKYQSYLHPDDLPMVLAKNIISKETLETFYCEARLVIPGRNLIWCSVTSSFSYLSENGSKVFTGFMLDITERKNAVDQLKLKEEKYRSIIANMNLGLLEVDTEEKILFANQSFCDMSGYDNKDLIGKTPGELFNKGENSKLTENKNKLRKEGVSDAYEIAVRNQHGQIRWWLISGAPRYDDTGTLVGSIGIHLDITKQKTLETDLIEAREQAEESTRSKEVFLANMSHEIRTPLNAIVGMSNQLEKTKLDSQQQFYLDTINSASENLLFIINDILDVSKIEAGKLQLEKIGFDPIEVVSRAIRVLSHKAEEKGLTITQGRTDATIAPVLMGDPFRLNQVLLNLVNNSIKFTEKGGVDISATVLKNNEHTQVLRISVTDTGIGMEEEFVQNLFEKFSQEDASITRQYGGTGLGMSISRDLVELMGGEINVKSKKGMGTAISFTIEFEKGSSDNLPVKPAFTFNADILKGKKILVVDDNQMNRLVAATILNNYGAITSEAVNGLGAVEAIAKGGIDIVLMDIQMPVMDGMEATGIIRRSLSPSLPIIALTANAIKGDNIKYLDSGMNAYLSKPYKEKDLVNIVAFWLNKGPVEQSCEDPVAHENNLPGLFDLSALKVLSRGNKAFVEKMVNMFVEQTPLQVIEMQKKFQNGDLKGMGAIAHKIKPAIDNIGIESLKTAIIEVERNGKQEQYHESLGELLETIKHTIDEVVHALKK